MGVNGIATTTTAAGDAAAAVKAMAVMTLEPATASSATAGNDCDLTDEPLGRRRTSIPSSFTYGDSTSTNANDANANAPTSEERRWRSFDCNGSSLTGAKAASLDVLKCRIQQEQTRVQQHSDRLRPRKRTALFRSFARVFSSSHKEQIELRRMEMVAHVAKANRSLVILRDMQTIVLTMDDESVPETPRSSLTADASVQRMLDGIADADQVLAEDSLHHILELQTQFLQKSVDMHGDKRFHVPRVHGVAPSVVLQQFLAEFGRCDGMRRVPCVLDTPTPALVKFEKLLTRYRLIKPQVKQSLDQLCRDTMSSFTRTGAADLGAASVWETRDRRDVLQSLVRELEETILEAAWVAEAYQTTLRTFIEQLVFSRLAGACYQSLSVELDEKNSLWRDQIAKARELQLQDVGLPVEIPEPVVDATPWFARSIEAFNRIPHLIPSCVMAAFLSAIRVLYEETNKLFGLTCPCISADVLLPLLVFVLSRTDLPHLHSQVYLMENFAIDESHEGSEAAYYLACLQAAMGYIMTEIDKKHD